MGNEEHRERLQAVWMRTKMVGLPTQMAEKGMLLRTFVERVMVNLCQAG
jgi:hypothetical protein